MTRVEGHVCRITLDGAARGTGFLVGPDTVLTNYHVLEPVLTDPTRAGGVECQFDYKVLADRSRLGTPVGLKAADWLVDACPCTAGEAAGDPERTIPTADELDYALVRIAEPLGSRPLAAQPGDGAPRRGWVRVPEKDKAPGFAAKMAIIIAQHPDGDPLKLALDTDAIDQERDHTLGLRPGGMRVRYATNTLGGSSGSPCFDFDWNLIALHHYGDTSYNQPRYNQGVPDRPDPGPPGADGQGRAPGRRQLLTRSARPLKKSRHDPATHPAAMATTLRHAGRWSSSRKD